MSGIAQRSNTSMQVQAIEQKRSEIRELKEDGKKVVQRTVNDFKSRGSGWVASAVTGVYNIKKKEVLGAKTGAKPTGKIAVETGGEIDSVTIVFEGRPLTPTHFGMKPKNRPRPKRDESGKVIKRARKYTVTQQVFKGQSKAIGSRVFLGSNKGSGEVTEIPFQRIGTGRTPIKSVKTASIPQMIMNERVAPVIQENIHSGLEKRLDHHIQRAQARQRGDG